MSAAERAGRCPRKRLPKASRPPPKPMPSRRRLLCAVRKARALAASLVQGVDAKQRATFCASMVNAFCSHEDRHCITPGVQASCHDACIYLEIRLHNSLVSPKLCCGLLS